MCYINQQHGLAIIYLVLRHRLHIITISLHPSITKGIQKQKIPVKQNKHTAQLAAAHPGDILTMSTPLYEQCGQGEPHWSKTTLYDAKFIINIYDDSQLCTEEVLSVSALVEEVVEVA